MKNRILLLMILTALSLAFLSSCSDDSTTNPSDTVDYFPAKTGNYWVYNFVTLDDNNTEITSTDSVVAIGTETKLAKNATVFDNFNNGSSSGKTYEYAEMGRLYQLLAGFLPDPSTLGFELPIQIPDTWALMANSKATAGWDIATIPLNNIEIDIPGYGPIQIKSGNIKFTGLKGAKTDVTAAGKTFSTQEFVINSIFTSTISVVYQGIPIDVNLNFTITTKRYYADKVGLVKTEALPTTISAKAFGTVEVFKREFKGSTSTLLRYKN